MKGTLTCILNLMYIYHDFEEDNIVSKLSHRTLFFGKEKKWLLWVWLMNILPEIEKSSPLWRTHNYFTKHFN